MLQTMRAKVLAAGAGLALLGSAVFGVAAVGAQQTPPTTTPPAATAPADTTAEPTAENPAAESATEPVEANDPALPGGGYADPAGVDAQHDFQGIE
jgi:hypothetical protein